MKAVSNRIYTIFFVGISIICIFSSFLYADATMVGFSDFVFLSGTNESYSIYSEITGGNTTNFHIKINNKEDIPMTYKLGFVDTTITTDGFNHKACLSENETIQFGKYISGDVGFFTLTPGSTIIKDISLTLPSYYSGLYHGCVTLYPSTIENTSHMNTLSRKGIFIDTLIHSNNVPFIVKSFSSNRVYQENNNANIGTVKFYDLNKTFVAESLPITINAMGTGQGLVSIPAGNYYVVFKGQSHLASYLSGVIAAGNGLDMFDFTTGTNLYGTQQVNANQNNGNRYQTAGDIKNILGKYDFMINGNDIAILTANGLQEGGISALDPRNLNGDGSINASDISVIGVNFEKNDIFFDGTFIW